MSATATPALRITEAKRIDRDPPRWVARGRYGRGYMSTSARSYARSPRLYVHVDGESIIENLAFRTARPSRLYRTVLAEAFEKLGIPAGTKARWSQYAGCSCPCSPGFILDLEDGDGRRDYFVTVEATDEAKFVATPENVAQAADRMRQLEAQGILDALKSAAPSSQQTARSAAGNLRNLKAMNEDKFLAVARAVAEEDNDPEALEAVKEEAFRRATA